QVARPGSNMKVTLSTPEGQVLHQHTVSSGEVWLPSLSAGALVQVDIRLARGLALAGKRRISQQVRVGSAGLIFDNRGRPLRQLAGKRRRQQIAEWFTAVTSIPLSEELWQAEELPTSLGLEEMGQVGAAASLAAPLDFPDYASLADAPPAPEIARLLEPELTDEPDFSDLALSDGEALDNTVDDLAKQLGLR
ncbi:MAG: hypothetical protein HC915_19925, partial [Anaerolineae bacterium]|nr:hypothetical protein [Anaerolineae bacterium]